MCLHKGTLLSIDSLLSQEEGALNEAISSCESAIVNADKVLDPISGKKSRK